MSQIIYNIFVFPLILITDAMLHIRIVLVDSSMIHRLRPETLAAVKISIVVYWGVTPCGVVGGYHRSVGTYNTTRRHNQKDHNRYKISLASLVSKKKLTRPTSTSAVFGNGLRIVVGKFQLRP